MKYLSAYALAWLSGKSNPTVKDLEAVISSIGGTFEKDRAEAVVESLTERDLAQVIRSGLPRLQVAGGAVSGASASSSAPTQVVETKTDDKKDDKKDEEADFDGALDMFGGDDY